MHDHKIGKYKNRKNHGSIVWRYLGLLSIHPISDHFRTSQSLQQVNHFVTWKWQVWPKQAQVECFLPRIEGCCIQVWIQSGSSNFHRQSPKSLTRWIQELHLILSTKKIIHDVLTLWNLAGKQLSSRFGDPPHTILRIVSRWCWKTVTHFPKVHQIKDAKPDNQELTDHLFETQVEGLQEFICLQHPIWWRQTFLCRFKNGAP